MTFIVSSTLRFLAAKWWSANHLCCVQAAQRPQGLALTRTTQMTLSVCGATPALTVCTAWPTYAMYPRSGGQRLLTEVFLSQIGHKSTYLLRKQLLNV